MSTSETSYQKIAAKNSLDLNDFVSSWVDSDNNTESIICCMISRGHGDWKVLDNVEIISPRSYVVNGDIHTYESHDHSELLEIYGCQVIFKYGMPDSMWYKKADETLLFEAAITENILINQ